MKAPLIFLVAGLVAAVAAQPAPAATPFRPCGGSGGPDIFLAGDRARAGGLECARVRVPVDRSGSLAGTIALRVERLRAGRRRRGAVFALAGGPGQAATPITDAFAEDLAPALRSRDLVVFDQRGTGRSGLLRCRSLERANLLNAGREAARCAQRLGPRRAFFTTRDSVEDIESVRQAIGVERISLFGVSYGTRVALAYAARYPSHVERLLLDSVVELGGPDPFYRETLAALPRALSLACARGGCRGISRDPTGDIARLVARLGTGPLRGYVVGADGRRRTASFGRVGLFATLLAGDFDESLRTALPGAVRSALEGDAAPILRLARRARAVEGEPFPPSLLSSATYAATTCEEAPLPWDRAASPAERLRQAERALAAVPDSALAPFDRATALASDFLTLCARWPAAAVAPSVGGALPDVPVLALAGGQDIRTPVESARRVAAAFPRGRLVVAPGSGHDVLGSDVSGCARRAVAAFFAGRRVPERCPRGPLVLEPDPVAPRSLSSVAQARGVGGRRGRTLTAARLTVDDLLGQAVVVSEAQDGSVRGGGLRRGRFALRVRGLARLEDVAVDDERGFERALSRLRIELSLRGVVFVPGVRVSGKVRFAASDSVRGRLLVSGGPAADGRLVVRGDGGRITLSGRLDGRRVRTSASLAGAVAAPATALRASLGAAPSPGAAPLAPAR